MSDIKADIEDVIKETFRRMDDVYNLNNEANGNLFNSRLSKLVFPKYSQHRKTQQNKIRVSEQELRFLFIEVLREYKDYYYSIETPTEKSYSFSDKENFNVPIVNPNGRSGCFDLVLFKDAKRVALIEFKAQGSREAYEKDLLKLANEGEDKECYFIDLLETASNRSYEAIANRLNTSYESIKHKNSKLSCSRIHYVCYCIKDKTTKTYNWNTNKLK